MNCGIAWRWRGYERHLDKGGGTGACGLSHLWQGFPRHPWDLPPLRLAVAFKEIPQHSKDHGLHAGCHRPLHPRQFSPDDDNG